jgi:cytidylate kinase
MINVIVVEREYGSGAAAIAEKLAGRLGWKLWDRDITCAIAKRLKCDVKKVEQREERLDPAFYRRSEERRGGKECHLYCR